MRCVYDFTQLYQLAAINAVPNHLAFSVRTRRKTCTGLGVDRKIAYFLKNRQFPRCRIC